MWRGASLGVALALAVLSSSPTARADTRPLEQAFSTEGACIRREPLAAQVGKWLGVTAIDAELSIRVVEEPGPPLVVTYAILRGTEVVGERRFSNLKSAACAQTLAVVALAIAVALDPLLVQDERTPPVARGSPTTTPTAPPPPAPAPIPAPPARSSPASRLAPSADTLPGPPPWIAAYAEMALGALPSAAFGGSVLARFSPAGALVLGVGVSFVQGLPSELNQGTLSASILAGRIEGCLTTPDRTLVLQGCLGAAGGEATGRGEELTATIAWVEADLGGRESLRLGRRFALELGERVFVPIVQPTFDEKNRGGAVVSSHAGWPVGVGVSLGIAFRL